MHNCNFCKAPLTHVFADLGHQPPSNSFLTAEQLDQPEVTYPLRAYVCSSCYLVQVPDCGFKPFTEGYVYFSSDSPGNVSHAKEFAEEMVKRFGLNQDSFILEIGSNDGYLLQWFKQKACMVHGIDPSSGPVARALSQGIPTIEGYFNKKFAGAHPGQYDLICGINVLAHQPDLNDFVEGLRIALKPGGVIVMEFPWLLKTIEGLQFDQIYQERYSYFSLRVLERIFLAHELDIFDAEELPDLHGGSLRLYVQHLGGGRICGYQIRDIIQREWQQDLHELEGYDDFQPRIERLRRYFLEFLMGGSAVPFPVFDGLLPKDGNYDVKPGKIWYDIGSRLTYFPGAPRICAYGAPAKASTFLNYCKVTPDLLPFTVDISLHKQGKFMPGSHVPILTEEDLIKYQPDYVIILGWNIKEEVMKQLSYIKKWHGRFVVAIPRLEII